MSILKRSKDNMTTFRPAVSTTEIETTEKSIGSEEDQSQLREELIAEMAHDLMEQPSKRKNPLDMISRNVNIAVSPRTLAEWRFVAGQQQRNMSDFIRRAVDFYIRKNGLDK